MKQIIKIMAIVIGIVVYFCIWWHVIQEMKETTRPIGVLSVIFLFTHIMAGISLCVWAWIPDM